MTTSRHLQKVCASLVSQKAKVEKHHDKWPEHHQDVMTSILGALPHLKLQEVRHDQPSQIESFLKLDILSTRASFTLLFPVGYSRLLGSVAEPMNEFVSESCCQKEGVEKVCCQPVPVLPLDGLHSFDL